MSVEAASPAATEAFERFFERTLSGMLARAITLCGHRADAEDAVQEAYTEAAARWDRLGGYDSPEAWVHKVMVQRLRRTRRQRDRTRPALDVPVAPEAGPERAALAREVLRVLGGLPQQQRMALVLHCLHGLPQREVARQLRITRGTVAAHVFKARRALEEGLGMTQTPSDWLGEGLVAASTRNGPPRARRTDPVAAALRETEEWLRAGVEAEGEGKARSRARQVIRSRVPGSGGDRQGQEPPC